MIWLAICLISLSILMAFSLILKDIGSFDYKTKEESIVEKEAEEKYLSEFPEYTSFKIKEEIGNIADILICNQESNRYTELLRKKAESDEKIKKLKSAIPEDVDILKYSNGNLKAKVKYRDYNKIYSMILNMSTVTKGRVFLNSYTVK